MRQEQHGVEGANRLTHLARHTIQKDFFAQTRLSSQITLADQTDFQPMSGAMRRLRGALRDACVAPGVTALTLFEAVLSRLYWKSAVIRVTTSGSWTAKKLTSWRS